MTESNNRTELRETGARLAGELGLPVPSGAPGLEAFALEAGFGSMLGRPGAAAGRPHGGRALRARPEGPAGGHRRAYPPGGENRAGGARNPRDFRAVRSLRRAADGGACAEHAERAAGLPGARRGGRARPGGAGGGRARHDARSCTASARKPAMPRPAMRAPPASTASRSSTATAQSGTGWASRTAGA